MPILVSHDILKTIDEEIEKCEVSFYVISAFCKTKLIKYFDSKLASSIKEKKIVVRLRPNDILSGATDLSLYEYCTNNNWKLFFRLDLHAKTYIFDSVRCIVGSANATVSGLSAEGVGNYEMAVCSLLDKEDKRSIEKLINSSTQIDDTIFQIMEKTISIYKTGEYDVINWPKEILDMQEPNYDVMFAEDFPLLPDPNIQNMSSEEKSIIKADFEKSRGYLWLISELKNKSNNELYFGEASAMLHDVLIKDPKPYRREVKQLLSNLLNWIIILDCTCIRVDRPNYSQRIRLLPD